MEGILHIRRAVRGIVESAVVGLVVGENPLRLAFGLKAIIAQLGGMCAESLAIGQKTNLGLRGRGDFPCPCVAEPERGQDCQRCCIGSAIDDSQPDRHVVRRRFGVFEEHIEVATLIENAGIDEFVFLFQTRAASIFLDEVLIGKFLLRVFVEAAHEGMRGRVREVVVVVLDVLTVVALRVGEPERAFF